MRRYSFHNIAQKQVYGQHLYTYLKVFACSVAHARCLEEWGNHIKWEMLAMEGQLDNTMAEMIGRQDLHTSAIWSLQYDNV